MKVWKKLTALLLAIGLTAGFVACGGGDKKPGGESGNPGSESNSGSEYVGEEVSQEEFLAARDASCAATNFTIVRTDSQGVTTCYSADGKVYSVHVAASNGLESYCYMGAVDGVYYVWTSEDQEYWEYDEMEWTQEYAPSSGAHALSEIAYWCSDFSYAEYESTGSYQGFYRFTQLQAATVYVMVSNGKIVKARWEKSQTEWYDLEITYGGATVGALPSLD